MHYIDKIVRRRCAGHTEGPEGDEPVAMQGQVPILQAARKTAGAHLTQHIDGVVDAPVDKEPLDAALTAEDSGSCCIKCHSDVETVTDIPPDSAAAIAVQAQTTENFADESLHFNSLPVERPYQVPQVMTQEVMVPVAGPPRVLGRSGREPVVQTEEKIVKVQQVQIIERIVEVLQIQCQEVIRQVTVPQVQEVVRQVTVLPPWCLRP